MQESRLFKIVYHLINKGQATAPELAKMLEVSIRTIYRDIDALSNAGIPIYATNGRNGGIKLLDNFVLSKSAFSEQEKAEILMGLRSLGVAQYPEADNIISKLSALFQMNADNWIEVDLTRWGSVIEREQKMFASLRKAIIDKAQVEFEYANIKGEATKRIVEPGKLVYRDKAWYLYGFCLMRNDWRLFRLTRIRNLILTSNHFDRVCNEVIWSEPKDYGTLVDLELQFKDVAMYRLYDILDEEAISQTGDKINVSVTLPETEWLYSFLMSFGDSLIMIEPERIRNEVVKRYKNAVKQFKFTGRPKMKINMKEQLSAFVSGNAMMGVFQFSDVNVNADSVKAIMINEVVPYIPADDFYGSNNPPDYLTTTLPLFAKAGFEADSVDDIAKAGIYITNAVKIPKSDTTISREMIEECTPLLDYEISLFPNLKVIMLMGDVAKKAFNMITKKRTGKNVVPSISTYKLRSSELYYENIRIFPSYIMTGGNILIEKSKVEMAAEDIQKMLAIIK